MIDAEESKNIYAEIGEAFCKAVTNWEAINHTIVFPNEVPVMLKKIIDLECKMALDPAISASANLLYQKGFSDGANAVEGINPEELKGQYTLEAGRRITGPHGSFNITAKEEGWTGSWAQLDLLTKRITQLLNNN